MRGNFKKLFSLILLNTIGLMSLLGCSSLSVTDSGATSVKSQIKVGVLLYNAEDPFIVNICDSITKCIKEEQETSSVKIALKVLNSENDQALQNMQIEQMIKEKYDAIAVNIVDRAEAANIIDKVKEVKIPIVFFNREPVPQDMNKWSEVYYIGANAAEAGEMQGQILLKAIQNDAKIDKNGDGIIQYVMLEGEPGHQDSILRSYHSIRVLEDAGIKTENVATDTAMWQRVQAKNKMLEWMEKFGKNIEVVLSNNDEMALGAIETLEEKGYYDKTKKLLSVPVIGVDGLNQAIEVIKNGRMLGTVLNNADEQGKAIYSKMYRLATGEQSLVVLDYVGDEKYLWIPHQIITKESIK